MQICQGDIVKISGLNQTQFVVVSKNAFIKATGVFHVCPVISNYPSGPVHITVMTKKGHSLTVMCEQIKMIDPSVRGAARTDSLTYADIMNVSDALQGIFEYD